MKYKIVKIPKLSGNEATIYSVITDYSQKTLFEKFVFENNSTFISEIKDIFIRLRTMGNKTGARENFFRKWEGNPGD